MILRITVKSDRKEIDETAVQIVLFVFMFIVRSIDHVLA